MLNSKHDVSKQNSLWINKLKTCDGTDIFEAIT